ncbi:hypothetical protein ACFLYO_05935 [Chloroflexota bacterium]
MTDEPNVEQIVSGVEREYRELRDKAAMSDATRELGNVSTTISGLHGDIEKLRERGYAFAGYLSVRADVLKEQWDEARTRIERQIQTEAQQLKAEIGALGPLMTKLGMAGGKPSAVQSLAEQVQERMERLEGDIESAEGRVDDLYGDIARDANEIKQKIGKFNWYMDQVDEVDFEFNATEAVYIVAKGEWVKTGKGKKDPDGLFYLTDQRLIFERKEKEGGFMGFGGKKVQGIEWEVPLAAITNIESEKKGFLGGKDLVHMAFSSGGPGANATIEVKGGLNANWYAQQLERAKSGAIDEERALEVAPEVAEMVRNAPTACANCGAPFTMPITRGMTEIACEYCGTIVRL